MPNILLNILNLTQHASTAEQEAVGVIDLPHAERQELQRLLTFETLPTADEIAIVAAKIAALAERAEDVLQTRGAFVRAMIGGAPFLMAPLERALLAVGVQPMYAFSVRASVEETQPDGTVKKVAVFRHLGFVAVPR